MPIPTRCSSVPATSGLHRPKNASRPAFDGSRYEKECAEVAPSANPDAARRAATGCGRRRCVWCGLVRGCAGVAAPSPRDHRMAGVPLGQWGIRRVPGSAVDVRWWVGEGEIGRMLVGTHQIAVPFGHEVGTGAVRNQAGNCHATLPGAVGLDRSIALADYGSSVLAAGAGRRR